MTNLQNHGANRTVAEEVAAVLRDFKVLIAFVVCGNQVNSLVFALEASGIRIVTCRHEAGAAAMAEAHARLTNSIGVIITIPGAGMANAITGLLEARTSCSPVLLLTVRQSAPAHLRLHDRLFHGMDHMAIADACDCSHESVVSISALNESLQRAMSILHKERPRPVVVEFDEDILLKPCRTKCHVAIPPTIGIPPAATIKAAVQIIKDAGSNIIIIAGRAITTSGANRELEDLARLLKASVVATTMAKGVFNENDPAYLGMLYEPCCRMAIEGARLAIIIGSRLGQVDTDDWKMRLPNALIRIDPDECELSYWVQPVVALRGAIRGTLAALNTLLQAYPPGVIDDPKRRKSEIAKLRGPMPRLARALNAVIPEDSVLAVDIHEQGYPLVEYYQVNKPDKFHYSGISLALGLSLSVAAGAKFAKPHSCVVAVCGDGGFILGSSDLATIAMYSLDLKIIVVTDDAYGTIKTRQCQDYGRTLAVDLFTPRLDVFAASYGFSYRLVHANDELETILDFACTNAETFIIEVPKRLLLQAT